MICADTIKQQCVQLLKATACWETAAALLSHVHLTVLQQCQLAGVTCTASSASGGGATAAAAVAAATYDQNKTRFISYHKKTPQ
jgi:hypothetical protein